MKSKTLLTAIMLMGATAIASLNMGCKKDYKPTCSDMEQVCFKARVLYPTDFGYMLEVEEFPSKNISKGIKILLDYKLVVVPMNNVLEANANKIISVKILKSEYRETVSAGPVMTATVFKGCAAVKMEVYN